MISGFALRLVRVPGGWHRDGRGRDVQAEPGRRQEQVQDAARSQARKHPQEDRHV